MAAWRAIRSREIRDDERQQPQSALAHEPPGSPGSSSMADGMALYVPAASRVEVYKVRCCTVRSHDILPTFLSVKMLLAAAAAARAAAEL